MKDAQLFLLIFIKEQIMTLRCNINDEQIVLNVS